MTPDPLPYQTPEEHPPRGWVAAWRAMRFDWATVLRSGLVIAVWAGILLLVLPNVMRAYMDFKLELPASTQFLAATHRVLVGGGWLILPLIPLGLGYTVAQLEPGSRRLARMLVTLLLAALVLFALAGVMLPMMSLVDGLVNGGKTNGR